MLFCRPGEHSAEEFLGLPLFLGKLSGSLLYQILQIIRVLLHHQHHLVDQVHPSGVKVELFW